MHGKRLCFFEKKPQNALDFSEKPYKLNTKKQRFIPRNKEYIGAARPYCTYYLVGAVYETLLLFFLPFFREGGRESAVDISFLLFFGFAA